MSKQNNLVINIENRTGITTAPMPGSDKAYVTGSRNDIQVPFRKISLTDTPNRDTSLAGTPNSPIFVYDTSGSYTDPTAHIDLEKGLPAIRQTWIDDRANTEKLTEYSSEYTKDQANQTLDIPLFAHNRSPLKAITGQNVSQMHYAR
ncbi:MAG: phosphomethylpyrimidine synthase ThiC, partial [Mycoplasmataceae bacterium]|nr:phosphomethylpyrimidine synthase ThiC [Mycoplasmataceae bacterium]